MSEEEIIKDLEKCIAFFKKEENFQYSSDYKWHYDLSITIENLLELYNREKEEKEEFKKALGRRITYCNELEKDLFENGSNYVISKDKIRTKIKELENKADETHGIYMYSNEIKILNELLEE